MKIYFKLLKVLSDKVQINIYIKTNNVKQIVVYSEKARKQMRPFLFKIVEFTHRYKTNTKV